MTEKHPSFAEWWSNVSGNKTEGRVKICSTPRSFTVEIFYNVAGKETLIRREVTPSTPVPRASAYPVPTYTVINAGLKLNDYDKMLPARIMVDKGLFHIRIRKGQGGLGFTV